MRTTSGSADVVVEHVVSRRYRITVHGHTCTIRIHLGSGCPANCVSVLQPRAARDPMVDGARFMATRVLPRWANDRPEMGQSRTTPAHWFLHDFARCFITGRELRREWRPLMCGISENKATAFLPLFLAFTTRDTFILFSGARKRVAAWFFPDNGAIFGAAEIEIYLITDTDARVTAAVVRTCGLFCPTWITRWWNIIDTLVGPRACVNIVKFYANTLLYTIRIFN